MTAEDAQRYGRKITLWSTGVVLILALIYPLIQETEGDFSNGILFFMSFVLHGVFIGLYLILFGLTWLFSGLAGNEIIIRKKKFYWVAIKYALIITICISVYATIIAIIHQNSIEGQYESHRSSHQSFQLPTAISLVALSMLVPLLLVWLWSGYKMSKQIASPDSPGLE